MHQRKQQNRHPSVCAALHRQQRVLILISRQLLESTLLILQMQPLLELIAKRNG
jgi:hypothetical protein